MFAQVRSNMIKFCSGLARSGRNQFKEYNPDLPSLVSVQVRNFLMVQRMHILAKHKSSFTPPTSSGLNALGTMESKGDGSKIILQWRIRDESPPLG